MKRSRPATDDGPPPTSPVGRDLTLLHLWQIQVVRDVLLVAAVVLLVWLGYALRAVTVPLLAALTLAYLFEPLVSWLAQRWQRSRVVVVGGLLGTVGVAAVVLLIGVATVLFGQTLELVNAYRHHEFYNAARKIQARLPEAVRDDVSPMLLYLNPPADVVPVLENGEFEDVPPDEPPADGATPDDAPADAAAATPDAAADADPGTTAATATAAGAGAPAQMDEDRLRTIVREELAAAGLAGVAAPPANVAAPPAGTPWWRLAWSGFEHAGAILGSIIGVGLLAFLIPFYFFFFSVSYPRIVAFGRSLIPKRNRRRALELLGKMDAVVAGFVRGRIVISLLMGVMLAVGWAAVGVPYAFVLGMVTGVFCAVPYLGGIGVPLAVGFLAFEKVGDPGSVSMAWWGVLLWPTVVFVLVQVIESYALTPAIAGKATNLDPVTILVAVLAGGSVMGVYGMLLAIPIAACAKIMIQEVILPNVEAWTRGELADPLPIERD